jgi:MinD-like ATPase involved in chromosome partitioning or flagellar assembly
MSTIAITAGKGSPGATTTAAALAAVAAARGLKTVLIELDPAGGTLALDAQVPLDPGLMTLAAAGRRGVTAQLLLAHAQRLPSGVHLLVAPTSPERASSIVRTLAGSIASTTSQLDVLTIIDGGRWGPGADLDPLVAAADEVLVVLRPTVAGVEHVRTRLAAISAPARALRLVAIGESPYPATEVAAALDRQAINVLADDERSATIVRSGAPVDRWLRRSPLIRSAGALLDSIVTTAKTEVSA